MSETPQFLKDLEEKHKAALKELGVARTEWEKAQEAIKKFPGWKLTGDYREPVLGEKYLWKNIQIPVTCRNLPLGPHFILRKVEPPPETEPVRETILAEAKELAKKILSNPLVWGCRPETIQLANRVNDIPDQPEPRTVWACPPEVEDKLANITYKLEHWAEREQIIELVHQVRDICRPTREATVEEVRKAAEVSGPFLVGDGSIPKIWANWDVIIRALNRAGLTVVKENSDG